MEKSRLSARATNLTNWRDTIHDPLLRAGQGLSDILLTGGGEWSTDIEMPRHLIEAAQEAIRKRPQYTHEAGILPLRSAIARKLALENGISVDPETEVVVTSGATQAVSASLLALVDPGDEVITPDPYYQSVYQANVKLAGGVLVTVSTSQDSNWRVDPDDVRRAVTARTKLIALTYPNNPTGACLSVEMLTKIAQIACEHDILVVSDEMYEKFVYDGNRHVSIASLPGMAERTVTINGFSKSYGLSGYRVGYLAGPRELVSRMAMICNATSFCPSEVSQRVALAALTGPQEWLDPVIQEYGRARNILVAALGEIAGVRLTRPDGAIYAFPNMSRFGLSAIEMCAYLVRDARVNSRPGDYFGRAGDGYVRFNIPPSEAVAREAGRRVQEAVARLVEKRAITID